MKLKTMSVFACLLISVAAMAQTPAQNPTQPEPTTQAPSPQAAAAVYEAVARYQIDSWRLGAHTYCFRVNGQDADKQFLERLKPLPVKPESGCTQKKNANNYTTSIVDKHSKQSAVMFGLGVTYWISPTQAAVDGGYMCGNQCMEGGVYYLSLDGNQWKVTKFEERIGQ